MRTRKRSASPQEKPTQHMEASRQDASNDLKSKVSSDFRVLPGSLLTMDSSDDEVYTDSLTSHTTASDSTIGNLTFPLGPISSRVEDPKIDSKTESQFSSSMPYLEDSTPLIGDDTPSINVSEVMIVSLYQTLILTYPVLYPLLTPPFPSHEGAPGVLKGNHLRGMERSTPLIP